jgi:hypothetical protein
METAPTSEIIEYNPVTAALASVEKYRGLVVDVSTQKGLAEGKAAHKEVAALRIALEKTRKKVKEDVVARGRLIDGEANRIFALIAAIEDPIKAQIEAEERREQAAREAAILAEQQRLEAEERARKEAEEKRLAEERAKNEAESRRLAEERAKLEAEQKATREKAEAEARARQAQIDEQERASKARIAEAEEKARKERQAEEDRLRAEREKVDAARREQEERERKEREAAEAKAAAERRAKEEAERVERERLESIEREKKRAAQDLLDAGGMLDTFVNRFGHMEQFASVVEAIRKVRQVPARKAA